MNQTWYLVDSNALSDLGRSRRASAFFRTCCRVTDDVVYEARYRPDNAALGELIRPMTPAILEQVRVVMRTVAAGDLDLVDLYSNKGAADPVLIATALDALAGESQLLLPDAWIIVTRDKAVLAKAKEFNIHTATPEELVMLIDRARH